MLLFKDIGDMLEFIRSKEDNLRNELSSLSEEELKNSDDSLTIIIHSKHALNLFKLGTPYRRNGGEVDVDITKDPRFWGYTIDEQDPVYKKAKRIEIHIPFEGTPDFLRMRPSTTNFNPPSGKVEDQEIILHFDFFSDTDNSEELNKKIDTEINSVNKFVDWMNKDLRGFNNSSANIIRLGIRDRREKLEKDKDVLDRLEIPELESEETLDGFVKPIEKIEVKLETTTPTVGVDPKLDTETYNQITNTVNQLGLNLERCSNKIRLLEEEPLRDIFFVGLNSTYRGLVSSETFNKNGKTDILIRYKEENLYISEFKIWRGNQYFTEGIDQLLDNLTWRDSKCSYVIFSRNVDFQNVINKAKSLVSEHSNFVSQAKQISKSCFKFRFYHKSNPRKYLYLTLHLFDIAC